MAAPGSDAPDPLSLSALTAATTSWMKLRDTDNEALTLCVKATLTFIRTLPKAADEGARDDVVLGAVMLASRLYRRRMSPAGVEAVTEAGATYVARSDSDVSRLLGLDGFAAPMAR